VSDGNCWGDGGWGLGSARESEHHREDSNAKEEFPSHDVIIGMRAHACQLRIARTASAAMHRQRNTNAPIVRAPNQKPALTVLMDLST
jgi:hypothetical protein